MNTSVSPLPTVLIDAIARSMQQLARGLDGLQPLLALALRLYVGWQFWASGVVKLQSWESTLSLFREEYRTPLLPPELAALAGTFGELFFPALLFVGLFGRLAALGLFAVNVMAVVSYQHVLLSEGFEAALGQHLLWGLMLAVLCIYGPGKLSLDHLLFARRGGATRI
jgi:putative oxidoreductase